MGTIPGSGSSATSDTVLAPPAAPSHTGVPVPSRENDGAISNASRRLRALAELSGSLTDALSPEEAADLVERQALAVMGASSAVIVTLARQGPNDSKDAPTAIEAADVLELVHAIGLPADVRATLQQFPLDAPVPLADVARTGNPIFLQSGAELQRYAAWGGALVHAGARAAAAVPVWANRQLRGVLGLTWPTEHEFDEDERAFVIALGVMCAQAILRARLTVAERRARDVAELANQSKTQFLRMISHELRTPMTAVLGYSGLLADEICGPINSIQKDHLRRMRDSGSHMLALIEELLGFAKLDAGEDEVRVERVIADDIVEQALALVMPLVRERGLRVRVEKPDAPIELRTDPLKLRQILVNLLANAVKYTDEGGVELILRIHGTGAELKVCFEVVDSGRGIARADQERVFEPFWQVDRGLTRRSKGTGLGLAVARQLARLLGGDVVIAKSDLGRGSRFVALIPAYYDRAARHLRAEDSE